jgi:hypothetical protein
VQQTYMQGQVRKPLPQQQQQQVTEVVVLEGRVMLHELITACCVSHGATGDAAVANAAVRSCPASVSTWLLLHLQLSSMLLTVLCPLQNSNDAQTRACLSLNSTSCCYCCFSR